MAVIATLYPANHDHSRIEIANRYLSGFAIVDTIIKEGEVTADKHLTGFLEINAPIFKCLGALGWIVGDFHTIYCSYIKY
jgi:hypothetical protein